MKVTPLKIPHVLLVEPRVFNDERGYFYESYNQKVFNEVTGLEVTFVQDSHSKSFKGVIRGLHFQLPPMTQGKLIRVVSGEVFDVAVDIRKTSPSFGKWIAEILSAKNKKQLWVPEGFAHGYLGLSNESELLYKTTNYYAPETERIINYNDPSLKIDWPDNVNLRSSIKDQEGLFIKDMEIFL